MDFKKIAGNKMSENEIKELEERILEIIGEIIALKERIEKLESKFAELKK
jgi:predicted  nucleic acid-binding Zn-ribbon protein